MPTPKPLATRVALVTGAGSAASARPPPTRLGRRGRLRRRRRPRPGRAPGRRGRDRRRPTWRSASPPTSPTPPPCRPLSTPPCSPSVASTWWSTTPGCRSPRPLLETTEEDWDLQHDVMAKGSFLVARAAAKVMLDQGMGGDIVYISSKNSVFAGPNNVAYGAAKADQAHQVRLLAAELGEHGIRVNGVNPDGVVRGSGIFAKRLGRPARRGLRRRGEGPRSSSTPSARSSSARCCPSTSPTRCSCSPAARSCRTPPACTSRSTPAWPRHSCAEHSDASAPRRRRRPRCDQWPGHGRRRSGTAGPGLLELAEVHRFPNGAGPRGRRDCSTGTSSGIHREVLAGLRAAAAGGPVDAVGIDSWAVDYGLLDSRRRPARQPLVATATRAPTASADAVVKTVPAAELYATTGLAAAAVQHPLPAGRLPRRTASAAAETMLLLPDLLGLLADRGGSGRSGPTPRPPALRRDASRAWATGLRRSGRCCRRGILPPLRDAGLDASARSCPMSPPRSGSRARRPCVAVGSHDTASAVVAVPFEAPDARRRLHLLGHLVAGRPRARRAGAHRGGARLADFTNEGGVDAHRSGSCRT